MREDRRAGGRMGGRRKIKGRKGEGDRERGMGKERGWKEGKGVRRREGGRTVLPSFFRFLGRTRHKRGGRNRKGDDLDWSSSYRLPHQNLRTLQSLPKPLRLLHLSHLTGPSLSSWHFPAPTPTAGTPPPASKPRGPEPVPCSLTSGLTSSFVK